MNISYVAPVGNNLLILDRDEKRVGKYMEKDEPVPAPIHVFRDVRKINIFKVPLNQEKSTDNINSDFYKVFTKTIEKYSSQEDKIELKNSEIITSNFQHNTFLLDRLLNYKSLNSENN